MFCPQEVQEFPFQTQPEQVHYEIMESVEHEVQKSPSHLKLEHSKQSETPVDESQETHVFPDQAQPEQMHY